MPGESTACGNTSCTFAKDGRCLEGFASLAECPNLLPAPRGEEEPGGAGSGSADDVELPDGSDYDYETLRNLTLAAPVKVIVLAGPVKSGKTTLLASLYHAFQEGPFGEYLFAGSDTLLGFERRSYLSRDSSGGVEEDTERTSASLGHRFVHLRVCRPGQDLTDLVFLDASGEFFEGAADSTEECQRLSVIGEADHFVMLLDGEKLTDLTRRHGVVAWARSMLRSALDAGLLNTRSLVEVVITKWDLVVTSSKRGASEAFVDELERRLRELFERRVRKIRFVRIAARPSRPSGLQRLHNVLEVFNCWIRESRSAGHRSPPAIPVLHTEFDRYVQRRGKEIVEGLRE